MSGVTIDKVVCPRCYGHINVPKIDALTVSALDEQLAYWQSVVADECRPGFFGHAPATAPPAPPTPLGYRELADTVQPGECITFPNGLVVDKRPLAFPPLSWNPTWTTPSTPLTPSYPYQWPWQYGTGQGTAANPGATT